MKTKLIRDSPRTIPYGELQIGDLFIWATEGLVNSSPLLKMKLPLNKYVHLESGSPGSNIAVGQTSEPWNELHKVIPVKQESELKYSLL